MKDRCFKLHGYLAASKNSKDRRFATNIQGENSDSNASNDALNTTHIPKLTKAQHSKLMDFLN